jgi:hypothetical protein
LEVKKIPVEEDGISNRQDSTTFVPPLTESSRAMWSNAFSVDFIC